MRSTMARLCSSSDAAGLAGGTEVKEIPPVSKPAVEAEGCDPRDDSVDPMLDPMGTEVALKSFCATSEPALFVPEA